jgi:hypothetical protein
MYTRGEFKPQNRAYGVRNICSNLLIEITYTRGRGEFKPQNISFLRRVWEIYIYIYIFLTATTPISCRRNVNHTCRELPLPSNVLVASIPNMHVGLDTKYACQAIWNCSKETQKVSTLFSFTESISPTQARWLLPLVWYCGGPSIRFWACVEQ